MLCGLPHGSVTKVSALCGLPRGFGMAATMLCGLPRGLGTAATMLCGLPRGLGTAATMLCGLPRGLGTAATMLCGSPHGSVTKVSALCGLAHRRRHGCHHWRRTARDRRKQSKCPGNRPKKVDIFPQLLPPLWRPRDSGNPLPARLCTFCPPDRRYLHFRKCPSAAVFVPRNGDRAWRLVPYTSRCRRPHPANPSFGLMSRRLGPTQPPTAC